MTVHLVGAGPGDPGLLTVRAAELLRCADVVVHDRLVTGAILELAGGAERIDVGKTPGHKGIQQERINQLLVELGRSGREIVRLKGGDPFVFGRGGEEALALQAARVSYTIVPGVSSAIAAPAAAGIPVTHRHVARSMAIVTGREDPDGPSGVNWERLAGAVDTIVVLMGAGRIAVITERLIAGGLDPATPLATITRAGWPDELQGRGTLADAADLDLPAATTIVIGAVAAADVRPASGTSTLAGWTDRAPVPASTSQHPADQAVIAGNGHASRVGQTEAGAVSNHDPATSQPVATLVSASHHNRRDGGSRTSEAPQRESRSF